MANVTHLAPGTQVCFQDTHWSVVLAAGKADPDSPSEVVHFDNSILRNSYPCVSPNGRWVATVRSSGTHIRIWNGRTGDLMTNLPAVNAHWPAFSPDGRWLACWQKDWITVWATTDWSVRRRIAHPSGILSHPLAFSPDGRILAIADYDRDLRLIQFETGAELATLPARRMTTTLGFSPAGDRLAVAHESGYLQLWDLRRVREQLAALNLDWDMPPYPPEPASRTARPFRVIVHTNAAAN